MEDVSDLLSSIGSIAWPLIVVVILIMFRAPIKSVIESAKSRKFTLKVGDNELTMEQAIEQQGRLLNDLQGEITRGPSSTFARGISGESVAEQPAMKLPNARRQPSILWVDDRPKNNSYQIAHLQDIGIEVITTVSTERAMGLFKVGRYDRIISDMGRQEGDNYNEIAGIDLVRAVRNIDKDIPIIIFCSTGAMQKYRQQAISAGANDVTNSTARLLRSLNISALGNAS